MTTPRAPKAHDPDNATKKQRLTAADWCVEELKAKGLTNVIAITDKFDVAGHAVFKATHNGERVAVRAYRLKWGFDCNKAAHQIIRCSSLHHPHIVQPKSLIRTPTFFAIAFEYATGGNLCRMLRRGGANGLPEPTANSLFQQLGLALDFCHCHGISLGDIKLSKLLIFWNENGMPILKISNFMANACLEGQAETPVVATMYTCPQMIRMPCREEWRDLAPDEKSAVGNLYALLQGSWPLTKQHIISWGTTPEKERADDRKALEAEAWFREDLPEGADKMTEIYANKMAERKPSSALQKLRELLARTTASDGAKLLRDCDAATPSHQPAGQPCQAASAGGVPNDAPAYDPLAADDSCGSGSRTRAAVGLPPMSGGTHAVHRQSVRPSHHDMSDEGFSQDKNVSLAALLLSLMSVSLHESGHGVEGTTSHVENGRICNTVSCGRCCNRWGWVVLLAAYNTVSREPPTVPVSYFEADPRSGADLGLPSPPSSCGSWSSHSSVGEFML